MTGMYRLRNALNIVVQKHRHSKNPLEGEYIVSVGDSSNNDHNQRKTQLKQQQPLLSNLSSEATEEVSAPSVFFQSTEGSSAVSHSSSSVSDGLAAPSLSDLYHNPYDPMSFLRRNIQRIQLDTSAMVVVKSNYTVSCNGESNKSAGSANNQSPTSTLEVPESNVGHPKTEPTTPITVTSTTVENTHESFCSGSMFIPSTPSKEATNILVTTIRAEQSIATRQEHISPVSSWTERSNDDELQLVKVNISPVERGLFESPFRKEYGEKVDQTCELSQMSPIKLDKASPWRLKKEGTVEEGLPEKSSSTRSSKSHLRMKNASQLRAFDSKLNDDAFFVSPSRTETKVVTPPRLAHDSSPLKGQENIGILEPPPPPRRISSTGSDALATMARLQELEQKKHELRRQRFALEQRLYQFCASKDQVQERLCGQEKKDEENKSKEASKENHLTLVRKIGRPWRTNSKQSKKEEATKNIPAEESPEMSALIESQIFEDRMVVNWTYITEMPLYASDSSNERKTLKAMYTGHLNAKGQPHGDDATLQYCDGQIYHGNVRAGQRSGRGHNLWPDGQEYKGEWLDNSRNGRGTHTWKDGRTVTGEWKEGHLHGKIYFSWPTGATFDGNAKMGKKDGRGIHTWADGKVYNGNYSSGRENGFGTLTLPDGVKYRGQFQDGLKEGYGIMLWKTRTYDGEWLRDKPHGQGRVVWSNGAIYTGQFKSGKYHGLGVYVWPSGKKFVGRWESGVKHGHGLYTWPNGKKYDGEYKDGLKEGYGRMTWADGSTYCGGFKRNKRHGRGVQTDLAGAVIHCGLWKDDRPYNGEHDRMKHTLTLTDADRMPEERFWLSETSSNQGKQIPDPYSVRHIAVAAEEKNRQIITSMSSGKEGEGDNNDSSNWKNRLITDDYWDHHGQPLPSREQVSICITDIE